MRLGAVFIPICMAVIAASLGAIAYLAFALSAAEALATAVAALSLFTAHSVFANRDRESPEAARQVAELSRGTAELARQVGELGRRVVAAEAAAQHAVEQGRDAHDPLMAELEVLGSLVAQIAEQVEAHEQALRAAPPTPAAVQSTPPVHVPPPVAAPSAFQPPPSHFALAPEPFDFIEAAPMFDPAAPVAPAPAQPAADPLGDIRAAVEANRLDLLLQPIVTLPQRKVRHYHVIAQLRDENGTALAVPEDFAAGAPALALAFDNFLLLRAMQVVRRLATKNPEGALICAISTPTLSDPAFVAQLSDFLRANRAFAPALSFALPHAALRAMKPAERTAMAHIASLGFRFTVERVEDLRLDPRELAAAGVRFVKTPAALLLDRNAAGAGHIHAADLGSLMARYGIELIADGVETEGTVLDLLDYEIGLAQGSLFSAPRPVRAEVFEAPVPPSAATAPAAAPQPHRRRDAETPPLPRALGERPTPSLARLARNIVRRA